MKFGTAITKNTGFVWVEVRGERIWFSHNFESKAVADIVDDAIVAGMAKRVEAIRRSAYNAGKRAARGGDKIEEFNTCINSDETGW